MSFVFILIELKSRFNRAFLIFGITNFFLAVFCGIDIWIQPEGQVLYWTLLQHILASFFPALISWYLVLLLNKKFIPAAKILFAAGFVFSVTFASGLMMNPHPHGLEETALYRNTFAPFMVLSILGILVMVSVHTFDRKKEKRVISLYHLISSLALGLGGSLDILCVIINRRIIPEIANYSLPGVLFYGMVITVYFANSLSNIVRDRELTFSRLQDAYREMDEAKSLKELGQSSAMINHEIRNYTTVVSGYAQMNIWPIFSNLFTRQKKIPAAQALA
jgi:hypothetical protein